MRTVSIEIDVEEIVDSMRNDDIAYLVQYLQSRNRCDEAMTVINGKLSCIKLDSTGTYDQAIVKLSSNQHRLSLEEEQYIISIASKL